VRRLVVLLMAGSLAGAAAPQTAVVALPFYRPADVMQGLYRHRQQPAAARFVATAAALPAVLQLRCDATAAGAGQALATAQAAWLASLAAWETLATVPLGPLIERRSARTLDFQPTRPALIERAIRAGTELPRVGAPAKGLPALEWLLWTQPVAPGSAACAYAVRVADELAREAASLEQAVAETARADWDESRGDAAFAELMNQWLGAAERLRWSAIDKPRKEAASRGQARPTHPRQASGQAAASWARQWQVLAALAASAASADSTSAEAAPSAPGTAAVALETYLRGRGLNPLADRWAAQIARSARAMQGLRTGDSRRIDAAVQALAATQALMRQELAPALAVSLGFSDADGD
jgi:uncharacterized protein